MSLSIGGKFPEGVEFKYIPIDLASLKEANPLACQIPINLSVDKLLGKVEGNILIVSVPGAFTPTCTENHIPPILEAAKELSKDQKVGAIIVISANDPFVINAWGKLLLQQTKAVSGSTDGLPEIIFASDPNAKFSGEHNLSLDLTERGFGVRSNRYALIVNKSRDIKYLGVESGPGVKDSGLEGITSAKL